MVRIDVEKLRSGPSNIDFKETPESFDLLEDPEFAFADPVLGSLVCRAVANTVLVSGTIKTIAETECSRCLERIRIPVRAEVKLTWMKDKNLLDLDRFPELRDDDVHYHNGDVIDATEELRECLLLELPQVPACELDPDGTCPVRGVKVGPMVFGPVDDEPEEPAPPPKPNPWAQQLRDASERLKRGKGDPGK